MSLPDRQRYALANPVDVLYSGNSKPYTRVVREDHLRLSTTLVITRRYFTLGEYCWHASVTIVDEGDKPIPFHEVSGEDFLAAYHYLKTMLQGVGIGDISPYDGGPGSLQYVRDLSSEEQTIVEMEVARSRNRMYLQERQRYALGHPLLTPIGVDPSRYTQIVNRGEHLLSTILTVGKERGGDFQWHASVAILGSDGKPVPFSGDMTDPDFEAAMDYAVEMIDDVGTGEPSTIKPDAVIHLFKDLSPAELAVIGKGSPANN